MQKCTKCAETTTSLSVTHKINVKFLSFYEAVSLWSKIKKVRNSSTGCAASHCAIYYSSSNYIILLHVSLLISYLEALKSFYLIFSASHPSIHRIKMWLMSKITGDNSFPLALHRPGGLNAPYAPCREPG